MKRLIAIALGVVVTVLSSCRETSSGLIVGAGTIYRAECDCPVWSVHSDLARDYELRNLPAEFQQNGLRVRFTLSEVAAVTCCMRWPTADVVSMRRL